MSQFDDQYRKRGKCIFISRIQVKFFDKMFFKGKKNCFVSPSMFSSSQFLSLSERGVRHIAFIIRWASQIAVCI